MKRIVALVLITLSLVLSLTACGDGKTYEDVLNEYTVKIEELTPTLVNEFKSETTGITDVYQLAEISNKKIQKLAEISNEGIGKMAEIKLKNNDEENVYEEWAKKLTDVYEREAKKITDEYEEASNGAINSLLP